MFQFLSLSAQENVTFFEAPEDLQFYQREAGFKSKVPISGRVTSTGYDKISVVVLRNNNPYTYQRQNLNYTNNTANFNFTFDIKSELAEYSFSVYLSKANDSTLVTKKSRVVSGETILVYGQSNGQAVDYIDQYSYTNQFCRTVNLYDFQNKQGYWVDFKDDNKHYNGVFALEIARNLLEKYKMPICLLNGSVGSKTLAELSQRNDANHEDPSTLYGQFLIKAKFAKLASKAPIFVWRQGEAEAVFGTDLGLYQRNFEKFRANLKEDFGGLKKMYVLQNNILMLESTNASELRDFQRRTKSLYSDIETLATVGTNGYDGLHYHPEGHRQTGLELSRLIGRDFFWTTDGYEINSPDLKKAFYSANKDSVILLFDNYLTEMVYQSEINLMDGKKRFLKDFIYLDNDNKQVVEGSSVQNRVILKLKAPSNAQKISYLPHFFIDWSTTYFYTGPFLTNSAGMRAFTFGSVPIAPALPVSNLFLKSVQFTQKKLTLEWTNNAPAGVTYRIERSKNNLADFLQIGTTKNKTFEDNLNFEKGAIYYYRIIAEDAVSESPESNIIEVIVPKSASMIFPDANSVDDPKFGITLPQFLERDLIVFPNPIEKGQSLTFFAKEDIGSLINLTDLSGKEFLRIEKNNADLIEIPTDNLKSGVYLMNIFKPDGSKASKRFIIK